MKAFATLLDRLVLTPQRKGKLALLKAYFASTPDPDRGIALAALASALELKTARPSLIRTLIEERADPRLFALSYDYVGDLAETVSLMWPAEPTNHDTPRLSEIVETLGQTARKDVPPLIARWLDASTPAARWALLKLLTGGLRVGVSARLAKTALASLSDGLSTEDIEEVWHGVDPPYTALFDWIEGRAGKPDISGIPTFRPLMLAHPLEEPDHAQITAADFAAEYKWDGIRVQLVQVKGEVRLYSRTGDDISRAFPDLTQPLNPSVSPDAVLDGELLVVRQGQVASFNELQQRLNRKTVTKAMLADYPAHIRLYDLLVEGEDDLRALPYDHRRARLEAFVAAVQPDRMDLSDQLSFEGWDSLEAQRAAVADHPVIEGLMLKRRASPYLIGRPKGHWYKWKREAQVVDAVLMYAQRGHGKRSSLYSDYTFGAVTTDPDSGALSLVPIGKAYSGFTDEELKRIDKFVRDNTIDRFGPVRSVKAGLVFEVAFDSIHASKRHKSGVAMRFPRIHRLRWDKPWQEADTLENVLKLIR